jgi:excisionase family DNA binding protein
MNQTQSAAGSAGTQGPAQEYLNARQLAELINASVKSIQKWTTQKRIPAIRVGRVWRYSRNEIDARLLSGTLLLAATKGQR